MSTPTRANRLAGGSPLARRRSGGNRVLYDLTPILSSHSMTYEGIVLLRRSARRLLPTEAFVDAPITNGTSHWPSR